MPKIKNFIVADQDENFIAITDDGHIYQVKNIFLAYICAQEEKLRIRLDCWITAYPEQYSGFKIIPVTISYHIKRKR